MEVVSQYEPTFSMLDEGMNKYLKDGYRVKVTPMERTLIIGNVRVATIKTGRILDDVFEWLVDLTRFEKNMIVMEVNDAYRESRDRTINTLAEGDHARRAEVLKYI